MTWPTLVICLASWGCAARAPHVARAVEVAHPVFGPAPARAADPAPPPAAVEPQTGTQHVVRPGETAWRIARSYGLSVDQLAAANGMAEPARLEVGRRLWIPGAAGVPQSPQVADLVSRFLWPVPGGRVLSVFGARRSNRRHQGLDIAGRRGEAVIASEAGHVTYSGATMRGYGKTVIVDHGNGFSSLYAHNSQLLVRKGQRVEQGQTIARVGRSGNASTDHCHFELRRGDVPIDPLPILDTEPAR